MQSVITFLTGTGVNLAVAAIFSMLLIFLTFKLLNSISNPAAKVVVRVLLVSLVLVLVNILGDFLEYRIPINAVTIFIPALFGIPGFALVALLQYLLP